MPNWETRVDDILEDEKPTGRQKNVHVLWMHPDTNVFITLTATVEESEDQFMIFVNGIFQGSRKTLDDAKVVTIQKLKEALQRMKAELRTIELQLSMY